MVFLTGTSKLINTPRIYERREHTDGIFFCVQIPFLKMCAADFINSQWNLKERNAVLVH